MISLKNDLKILLLILVFFINLPGKSVYAAGKVHSFEIRAGNFYYDGQALQIISGEFHYTRVPHQYWRQRLEMLKAMGLNTVSTYVFWNFHEPEPGKWNFSGDANLAQFVKTAGQVGLHVILRPGPYACAEWEYGGFPWWLLRVKNMEVRADNPEFLKYTKIYIDRLYKEIGNLQVTKGGPIIMVQLENEFGSYVAQRKDIPLERQKSYIDKIKKLLLSAGFDVPLYTADGSWLLSEGGVPGVLPAVNGETDVTNMKKVVDAHNGGKGPYFASEYYPGWLSHWNEDFPTVGAGSVAADTRHYMRNGISFNYYMAFGGTNFGFWSGANYDKDHDIQPDMTSYDYDAPVTEAGWETSKFDSIRNILMQYEKNIPPVPVRNPVIAIPSVKLTKAVDLLSYLKTRKFIAAEAPLSFEELNQGYGYVLYSRKFNTAMSGMLNVFGLRDFATVYIDGRKVGILNRNENKYSMPVAIPANATLDILVENMGRINYGSEIVNNNKGIVSPVKINDVEVRGEWKMYPLPFSSCKEFSKIPGRYVFSNIQDENAKLSGRPLVYRAEFNLEKTGDTFLDMEKWGKGIVFVNGINIGRYWKVGPQQTLYVPGVWLKKGKNEILVFEQLNERPQYTISSLDIPVLNRLKKSGVEPPRPYGKIPSKSQVAWQKMEIYMFTHFGPNTFTNKEWGNGKENPDIFNPINLDCAQWAATAKEAGMKGIILTAKHHDGFCLWPSKYSTHTVRQSAWKNGKGDVLKDLSLACREYGIKFGVYLSPWDRNHPAYGTSGYNTVFVNMLKEIYASYGKIFEQWFDGANGEGPNGKKQVYDWDLFDRTVYESNPDAVIFSDVGPGCRWVGNEKGFAGETNWSTLNVKGYEPGKFSDTESLNQGNMNGEAWIPAESDVSIRPGWFYSPDTDDQIKSVDELMDIYYKTVGRNANLLLNVPPDREGRISKADSIRLTEFKKRREAIFSVNLAKGAKVSATATRGKSPAYSANNVVDDHYDSYWTTDDDQKSASLTLTLDGKKTFNRFLLQEYIPLGQRIESFNLEYFDYGTGQWKVLQNATTVGYKRILLFPSVETDKIRINITRSLACPLINNLGIYDDSFGQKDQSDLREKNEKNLFSSAKNWKVLSPLGVSMKRIIDGNDSTFASVDKNKSILIDLGRNFSVKGFYYLPSSRKNAVNVYTYDFYAGKKIDRLNKIETGSSFGNIKNNPILQKVDFDRPIVCRYIRFSPKSFTREKGDRYDLAELGAIVENN